MADRLEIAATTRFVHLVVTDIDPRPIGGASEGGRLAESGRGLGIVDWYATTRWVVYEERRKAVHVIVAALDVALTPAELDAAIPGGPRRPLRTPAAAGHPDAATSFQPGSPSPGRDPYPRRLTRSPHVGEPNEGGVMAKEQCGTCNGQGGWWDHGNGQRDTKPKRWIKCWDCDGRGTR